MFSSIIRDYDFKHVLRNIYLVFMFMYYTYDTTKIELIQIIESVLVMTIET